MPSSNAPQREVPFHLLRRIVLGASTSETFTRGNALASFGWLTLVFRTLFGNKQTQRTSSIACVVVVAGVLSGAYLILLCEYIAASSSESDSDSSSLLASFSTLEGASRLFRDEGVVCAGWLHYLAFDLLIGERLSAIERENNIPRVFTVGTTLPLTFIAGPVGYLWSRACVWLTRRFRR